MVLYAESYPGAAYQQQESYTIYQERCRCPQDCHHSNFSGHARHRQSGGADYLGNGASHGMVTTGMPNTGGYGSSDHKQSHGYGDSYGHGNSTGYMGNGGSNMFEKMKHGVNSYGHGNSLQNYNHSSTGMNNGYQRSAWLVKGIEDEEE